MAKLGAQLRHLQKGLLAVRLLPVVAKVGMSPRMLLQERHRQKIFV